MFFLGGRSEYNKKYECPICRMNFKSYYTLYAHKKNIHEKSHQCEVCLRYFASKWKLDTHSRTHTDEKPYVCSICGRKFALKATLQTHQASHSDERKFKCSICPHERSYKIKQDLARHMRLHNEPKHACFLCKKKFYHLTVFKNHLKAVHNLHIPKNK